MDPTHPEGSQEDPEELGPLPPVSLDPCHQSPKEKAMGEMKNLQPGDTGWSFMQRIQHHNATLVLREQVLWSLMPKWRKLLRLLGFKRQAYTWYYDNRYLMSRIDDFGTVHSRPLLNKIKIPAKCTFGQTG